MFNADDINVLNTEKDNCVYNMMKYLKVVKST